MAGLAAVLSWPRLPLTVFTGQLENLYGFLAVFGLITTAILGMLFKILPFLVWYGTYSIQVGRARVPNLSDMYSAILVRIGGLVYLGAVVITGLGILVSHVTVIRWGAAGMAVAVVMHLLNYGTILRHRFRPRLQPVTVRTQRSA
jgi:hypothetical protein